MSSKNCPNCEELSAYALGKLQPDTLEVLSDHIEECPACQATLATLEEAEDTLVARLRLPAVADKHAEEPECQEAVVRVKAMIGRSAAGERCSGDVPTEESAPLRQLGEYQLLQKLGQGGMGAVYKARQTKLKRIVALKVLPKERMEDQRAVARFEREMEAVGAVDHPNIVRAMHAGEADGVPYLVVEYVEGLDLSELVKRSGPLRVPDACELIRQAAIGLQYAHEHGLVHRDIKPSNLMLTAEGRVKILDLGLALLQAEKPAGEELTGTDQVMGTFNYMSPEQTLETHTVDIRADIYSLGCTLYKLLTGHAPFTGPEYDTPMKKAMGHGRDPIRPIRMLRADIPEELAAVIDRMLAKEPAERFATPAEVVTACEPFATGCDLSDLLAKAEQLASVPAEAEQSGSTEEWCSSALASTESSRRVAPQPVTRPLRRHWRPVAIGAVLAGIILLAFVLTVANRHGVLVIETDDQNVRVAVLQDGELVEVVDADSGWAIRLKSGKYEVDVQDSTDRFELDQDTVTVRRDGTVRVKVSLRRPVKTGKSLLRPKPVPINIKPGPLQVLPGAPLGTVALVTAPETIEGVRSWTIETRAHRGPIRSMAYSPDDRLLATAGDDGVIRLWNAGTNEFVRILIGHDGPVTSLSWSPDGKFLASGTGQCADPSSDIRIRVWDTDSGLLLWSLKGLRTVLSLAWSPDGRIVACAEGLDPILRDAASGRELRKLREHPDEHEGSTILSWSPDGKILANTPRAYDGVIKLWDAESGKLRHAIQAHERAVFAIAWSPDGTTLATTSAEKDLLCVIKLWDAETGELRGTLSRVRHGAGCLAWLPDGKTLAAGRTWWDNKVRLWDLETGEIRRTLEHGEPAEFSYSSPPSWDAFVSHYCLACSPDGKRLAVGGLSGVVPVWETESGQLVDTIPAHAGILLPGDQCLDNCLAFSPDGKLLARASFDGPVRIWQTASGQPLAELKVDKPVRRLAWSPDGRMLATSSFEPGGVRIWDVSSGECARELPTGERITVKAIAWSPDGTTIATGASTGKAKLWDAASGELLRELPAPGRCLAWSPDGKLLAVGAAGPELQLCDPQSARIVKVLSGAEIGYSEECPFLVAAWSPDAGSLATFSWGRPKDCVWDVDSGDMIRGSSEAYHAATVALCWLDNGKSLAMGRRLNWWGRSGPELVVWDIESDKQSLRGWVDVSAFSPDGQLFASRGESTTRVRRVDDKQLLYTMLSLRDGQYAVLSPKGHYRGSAGVEKELVYVVQTDTAQDTLTPEDFSKRYGWRNDPGKAESGKQEAEENTTRTTKPTSLEVCESDAG